MTGVRNSITGDGLRVSIRLQIHKKSGDPVLQVDKAVTIVELQRGRRTLGEIAHATGDSFWNDIVLMGVLD